jgi:hypothetical protein
MYEPVETLIRVYPYVAIQVYIRVHDIFVLLGYNFIEEVRIIQLPQSSHESFRRLMIISRLNNVNIFL